MKALALVDATDHVCCRYRIRAFEPALEQAGWSLTIQALRRDAFGRWAQFHHASQFDIVILQRRLLPRWQLSLLRRQARRLIFDFDDAVLYRDSFDPRGPHCRRRAVRFSHTVQLSDTVLAGNEFLADCAHRAGAKADRVVVIPTCVDLDRYPRAEQTPRELGLDLVWIGSSSTLQGLVQQSSLWERMGRELPGIRLRVICDRFPKFQSLPVVGIPWSEARETADLAAGDVGISWVPDDVWSRGKCGLKILQYQAAGLPVVTNPVGVHSAMITQGESGFLATTPDEWVNAIRRLAGDFDLRQRMGRHARSSVETAYSLGVWGPRFVAALSGSASPNRMPSSGSGGASGQGSTRSVLGAKGLHDRPTIQATQTFSEIESPGIQPGPWSETSIGRRNDLVVP